MIRRLVGRVGRADDGTAVVEFVLVGALLLLLTFGAVQVGLVLHARNVLAADAAEGARHAAELGVAVDAGAAHAEELAHRTVPGATRTLSCSARQTAGPAGVLLAEVTCHADVRLAFVPIGAVQLTATGRAVKERDR